MRCDEFELTVNDKETDHIMNGYEEGFKAAAIAFLEGIHIDGNEQENCRYYDSRKENL